MAQITARLPAELLGELDRAAARLRRSRTDVVQRAIEAYLEDLDDLEAAAAVLADSADPVLEWASVRRDVLRPD